MAELRQDPLSGDWVVINPKRGERPHDGGNQRAVPCPFCPGNEKATPPATDVVAGADGRWLVRAVPNRFPILEPQSAEARNGTRADAPWHRQPAVGGHEVIIEAPEHDATFAAMDHAQRRRVIEMYVRRYRALSGEVGARHVVLFRNQGGGAGRSLVHPHAQIVSVPVVAPETRHRMQAELTYFDNTGRCGTCHVLERELDAQSRIVHAGGRFVTLAPYASRVPFHVQVVPRRHTARFSDIEGDEIEELAATLGAVTRSLDRVLDEAPHNLVVATAPLDELHPDANHWVIDVLPRLGAAGGFELGSHITVNREPPERAAAAIRDHWNMNSG